LTTAPLPTSDPAHTDLRRVIDRHRGERVGSRANRDMFHELLEAIVEDRVRQAGPVPGMAEFVADLDPSDRLELTTEDDSAQPKMWVRSGRSPMGAYTAVVEFGDDYARSLLPHEIDAYTNAIFTAVAYAEYDAAVVNQLRSIGNGQDGIDPKYVAGALREFRESRPPIDQQALRPMVVHPAVGANSGRPFLEARIRGTQYKWQWDTRKALDHVEHVRDAVVVADLDAAYRRYLIGVIGLDAPTAEAAVGALAEHRILREP
jgi:hypothetical protein